MNKIIGKFIDIKVEGGEIDTVVFNSPENGEVELINKTGDYLAVSIITEVPVVQFREKTIKLKPKESKKVKYDILYKLVETHLEGNVIFTAFSNTNKDRLKLPVHLKFGGK